MRRSWVLVLLALVLLSVGLYPLNCWWLSWFAFYPLFALSLSDLKTRPFLACLLAAGLFYFGWGLAGFLNYDPAIYFLSVIAAAPLFTVYFGAYRWITRQLPSDIVKIIAAPALWILFQKILSYTPIGTLATDAAFDGPLAFFQITPILGFTAHEAVIVGLNAALAFSFPSRKRGQVHCKSLSLCMFGGPVPFFLVFGMLLIVNGLWGKMQLSPHPSPLPAGEGKSREKTYSAALIQHNLPSDLNWRIHHLPEIRQTYRQLAEEAGRNPPDLTIFPLFDIGEDIWRKPEVFSDVPQKAGSPVLLSTYIPVSDSDDFYDMALLFDSNGRLADIYQAIAPPPFRRIGEVIAGNYKIMNSPVGKFGIFLCYENGLARMAKKAVNHGAEVLVSLSNPAFFNRTRIPYYHFFQDRLRALESGRYLIQVSASGYSGVIDPQGRILKKSNLNESEILRVDFKMLNKKTPYHRFDWLAFAAFLFLGWIFWRKFKNGG